jgi:glycosyltransferase involved in cell wall biosynthesis
MFYFPGVLKGMDSYWVKRVVLPAIRELDAERPVDVIDAHFGYPEGVGCVLAARRLRRPVFITMRGLERQILDCRWRKPQMLRALHQCAGIVCVSQSLYDLARDQGIDIRKLCVIPNAVERNVFHFGPQVEARRELGLSQDQRLIVCVGMFEWRKGQHILLQAFSRLLKRVPDVRLALIGGRTHERGYPELVERTVADLGLQEVVLRPGPQKPERVATWLRAADLFALPTYDEGCCNAILEALACGLPVVTTPVGDNALQVDAPRRGFLVPPGDADRLAEALHAALNTTWDRRQIADYGIEHTWEAVARQTVSFFEERLRIGGASRPTR